MNYEKRRALFEAPDNAHRPMYYYELPPLVAPYDEALLRGAVADCRRCGCGAIIPQLPMGTELDAEGIGWLRDAYAVLLEEAKRLQLKVGLYLDPALEHAVIRMLDDLGDNGMRAKLLECKEYLCRAGETVKRKLHEAPLLSLVAVSEEFGEVIDLRPFVSDGTLIYEVPDGNWVIHEYLAVDDTEREAANYLSYEASYNYICAVFSLFSDVIDPYLGKTLSILSYSGIGFNGKNRRSWDVSFNALFEKHFGFDPAIHYPVLFGFDIPDASHVKAVMMKIRASMIQHGIMQAARNFADRCGLEIFGNLSEPKSTACSWLMGDTMLNNIYSPCALFDKAYLYGTNSVKIAAGAAYNFDNDTVNGELFRNYAKKDKGRLYKDAMNAYARGVNRTALHLSEELAADSEFCDFTARVQTMLRGGCHVADIAMLYPIYTLHGKVCLYNYPAEGYEYPSTPSTADYMTVINAISLYAGHDLTVLHPVAMNERCHTEGGVLYLDNEKNKERFRVMVLPATEIISLGNMRMLKKFFDEGGKILATGILPDKAFEYDASGDNDREVQRLAQEIFGEEACSPRILKRYCHNKNEQGGEAIFLYFNASAIDGTKMTKGSTINEALNSFGVPFDIYIPGMQRLECTGALNAIYPEFHNVGLDLSFPGGGMVSHIHKATDDGDIYYFSNTTDEEYNHHVLLRGAHRVEKWDPHTGEIGSLKQRFLRYRGEIYTNVRLSLPPSKSAFFHTVPADIGDSPIQEIDSIDHLQSEHAALMSEF